MLLTTFYILVVIFLTALAMLAVSYDRRYKTIEMPEVPVFIGFFFLFTILSVIFTAFLFEHTIGVLSVVGVVATVCAIGFGMYKGLLRFKDFLDIRNNDRKRNN